MSIRKRFIGGATLLPAIAAIAVAAGPAAAAAAAPDTCPKHPSVGEICGHTRILLVAYSVKPNTPCHVQANYPHNPGTGRKTWTINPGARVIWRYNVNSHVAAIADPAEKSFPHWGFVTNSECVGATVGQRSHYWRFNGTRWVEHATPPIPAGLPMPKRLRSGRSQNAATNYWNDVDWTPAGPAVPAAKQKLAHNRTLRDRPNEFVIGNVRAGWQVRPTGEKQAGYTKVYVPSLKRWGWLQL